MAKARSLLSRFLKLFCGIRLEPFTPVDIVIPARNAATTLARTVDSIKNQTHHNFQCWIVDDCSFDQTWAIADEICKSDDRFHLVQTPRSSGPAGARNLGVRQGCAPLVAFCDADDTWSDNKLERQVDLIEKENTDVALSGVRVHYPNYGIVSTRQLFTKEMFSPEQVLDRLFSFNMAVCGSNLLVSRAALIDCGLFDLDLNPSDDYDILLKLAHLEYRFSYDPKTTVNYIRSRGSITSTLIPEILYAMRKCVDKWRSLGCDERPIYLSWKSNANKTLFEIPAKFENPEDGDIYFIANPYLLDANGNPRTECR